VMRELNGKIALVTGGAKRIGRAICTAFASAGVNVIVHFNKSENEARNLADELWKLGVRSWAIGGNLTEPNIAPKLMDAAFESAGGLDILVNNASSFPSDTFQTATREELISSIDINAWAPFALTREFAARAVEGHVVNLLDTRLAGSDFEHVSYISAKHLLWLYTRMAAMEFAPGIQVNAVAPGLILPPPGKDTAYLESAKDRLPLRRIGSPEEVAATVVFLARSRFITGQVIYVDGGRHLREGG